MHNSNLTISDPVKADYFEELELAQKSLINKRQELTQMVTDYKRRRDKEFNQYCLKFIDDNCQYKPSEIIEAKSRFRTRRMKIDHLMLRWILGVPVIIAHGYFLNRKGENKKYNKKGFAVYGVEHRAVTIRKVGKNG